MEKKFSWSASGELQQHNPLKTFSLQCDFNKEPGNYTAQFSVNGTDLSRKRPIAEISWSVEGNTVRRIISIADGVSIQGAAQNTNIKIYDTSATVLVPPDTGLYRVSVQVVRGTRGSTSNPPIYDSGDVSTIPAFGATTIAVPLNAGVISTAVTVTDVSGVLLPQNQIFVSQRDSGGINRNAYDPRQYFWVPLSPGCTEIYIQNLTAEIILAKVIFGIDG